GTSALLPPLIAGLLPQIGRIVCVGPPLFASGSSCGFVTPTLLPLTPLLNPPPRPIRLNLLLDVLTVPAMSSFVPASRLLPEMIEFVSTGEPALTNNPPPLP